MRLYVNCEVYKQPRQTTIEKNETRLEFVMTCHLEMMILGSQLASFPIGIPYCVFGRLDCWHSLGDTFQSCHDGMVWHSYLVSIQFHTLGLYALLVRSHRHPLVAFEEIAGEILLLAKPSRDWSLTLQSVGKCRITLYIVTESLENLCSDVWSRSEA